MQTKSKQLLVVKSRFKKVDREDFFFVSAR